ncbi:MAG: extensin family protein [Hyphomicrobiaceae bacterium]|nr:extensin family protein [Hyphomicrobiaceae bacterium]
MRRAWRFLSRVVLLTMIAAIFALPFWFGLIPQRWSPFPPIALSQPANWFLDVRLAALRRDPDLCRAVLIGPYVDARPISDEPLKDGCGVSNAVRLRNAGGASIPADKLSCEVAAAFALWMTHHVQPAALKHFGKRVTALQNFGTFSCRNIVGNPLMRDIRSQHATANAIDIAGFTLEDGTAISLARNWKSPEKHAAFLREVHRGACGLFRASLSPDFNEAHKDHFHFDRGPLWTCR